MMEFIARLFPHSASWVQFWKNLEFGREDKLPWVAGFAALMLLASWIYRRDTVALHPFWKITLFGLRLCVLLLLLAVALVPQERKSRIIEQVSRVVFLVDTSVSMGIQDQDAKGSSAPVTRNVPTRAETVRTLLQDSPLVPTLRRDHAVTFYTFDSKLLQQQVLEKTPAPGTIDAGPSTDNAAKKTEPAKPIDWARLTTATGLETRLGESLLDLIRRENGETLSGIVVLTDGGSNAGIDPATAAEAAIAGRVKLFPVGVGSTRRPVNLQLAELQSPTHVHIGDGFSLVAFVSGQGFAGQSVQVELLSKLEKDEGEPVLVESRDVTLLQDGIPVSVSFDYTPTEPGKRQFRVRVKPAKPVQELVAEDNEDRATVDVIDKKTKILLIAGGPMRDYQFVRNLLFRDKSMEMDVLLQTGSVGISQESDKLLFAFPESREELFAYDVIVAFDPNWKLIRGEKGDGFKLLSEWVDAHAGGLILVAGEVNTPQLASASGVTREEAAPILELYPVVLDSGISDQDDDFAQPWPIAFTREGLESGFLQLTDNAATSATAWKEFPGVFRCYPTSGPKAGATVYARFTDPRGASDQPILIASQFFGSGRVLYLGSAELWRLRALEEDYYDRLWVKMVREVGQGRLLRGTNRGILLLEKKHYPLGATVQVRARVLDPQFKEYKTDVIPLEVYTPNGRPLTPAVPLVGDKNHPGHYLGAFVVTQPGTYNLQLPIPESKDEVRDSFAVKLPNLEYDHPEQNSQLLRSLARERDGGGRYLTLDEAAAALPALLPNRGTEKVQFDFPIPLWDKEWMMYLLVGLLSLEWLARKLLKLA